MRFLGLAPPAATTTTTITTTTTSPPRRRRKSPRMESKLATTRDDEAWRGRFGNLVGRRIAIYPNGKESSPAHEGVVGGVSPPGQGLPRVLLRALAAGVDGSTGYLFGCSRGVEVGAVRNAPPAPA